MSGKSVGELAEALEIAERLIQRDGRYPPMPRAEIPDKDMALDALALLRSELIRLHEIEAALRPFADRLTEWETETDPADRPTNYGYGPVKLHPLIPIEWLHSARAALSSTPEAEEQR